MGLVEEDDVRDRNDYKSEKEEERAKSCIDQPIVENVDYNCYSPQKPSKEIE